MVASLLIGSLKECEHLCPYFYFTFYHHPFLLSSEVLRSPCDSCWMDVLNISPAYVKHHLAGEVYGKLLLCASVFHWSHC